VTIGQGSAGEWGGVLGLGHFCNQRRLGAATNLGADVAITPHAPSSPGGEIATATLAARGPGPRAPRRGSIVSRREIFRAREVPTLPSLTNQVSWQQVDVNSLLWLIRTTPPSNSRMAVARAPRESLGEETKQCFLGVRNMICSQTR
jgi:hypothetical protein